LADTRRGDEKANPYIQPGDIVTIPVADEVYVTGNVNRPMAILLNEPLTVTQAIAKASGEMENAKVERIRIIRQEPGSSKKTEILVDLKAIKQRRGEDIALQPNDIVEVPGSKPGFLQRIGRIFMPSVTQLPVRVIY